MTDVTVVVSLAVDCFCTPPKRLTTDEHKQSDRCDVCGFEILSGVPATGPRLRLLPDPPAAGDS